MLKFIALLQSLFGSELFTRFWDWITGRKEAKIKKQVKEVLDEAKRKRNLDDVNRRVSRTK